MPGERPIRYQVDPDHPQIRARPVGGCLQAALPQADIVELKCVEKPASNPANAEVSAVPGGLVRERQPQQSLPERGVQRHAQQQGGG